MAISPSAPGFRAICRSARQLTSSGLQIEKLENGLRVTSDKGDVFEADAVLFATGKALALSWRA